MKIYWIVAVIITGLLLAYPLSVGPVTRYYMGNSAYTARPMPSRWVRFYQPLVRPCDVSPVKECMRWYEYLWLPEWYVEDMREEIPVPVTRATLLF